MKRSPDQREEPLAHVILLDVRKVAQLLGVHQRTIWRMVASGDLPAPIRLGAKTVRWRLLDLERHIQNAKG